MLFIDPKRCERSPEHGSLLVPFSGRPQSPYALYFHQKGIYGIGFLLGEASPIKAKNRLWFSSPIKLPEWMSWEELLQILPKEYAGDLSPKKLAKKQVHEVVDQESDQLVLKVLQDKGLNYEEVKDLAERNQPALDIKQAKSQNKSDSDTTPNPPNQGEETEDPKADPKPDDKDAPQPKSGAPTTATGLAVGRFLADDNGQDSADLIGTVDDEAYAFAKFLACKYTRPPLAVGLFGDWGHGKSFFMNRIQGFMTELSDKIEDPDQSDFHKVIVPIRFNAWHYIESNLWAGLVDNIFTELYQALSGKEGTQDQSIEELYECLESVRQMKQRAVAERDAAAARLKTAGDQLAEAEKAFKAETEKTKQLTAKNVWKTVQTTYVDELKNSDSSTSRAVHELKNLFGDDLLEESAQDLHHTLTEMNVGWSRFRHLGSGLLTKGQGFLILIAVIVLCPAVGYGLLHLLHLLKLMDAASPLQQGMFSVSTLIGSGGVYVRHFLKQVNGGMVHLTQVKSFLDDALEQQTADQRTAIIKAEENLTSLEFELEKARDRVRVADLRLAQAEKDLEEGNARSRIRSFINERVESGRYSQHLGLIADIHKDFNRLSDLMLHRQREEQRGNYPKEKNLPHFDRIVLYIDDLDRCPPERVVEVLQAVHMLLAFELFVVVVAVDVRWVTRSLYRQHREMISEENPVHHGDTDFAKDPAATAHDYLEKIFQIPFWVRRMGDQQASDFMMALMQRETTPAAQALPGGEAFQLQAPAQIEEIDPGQKTDGDDPTPTPEPPQTTERDDEAAIDPTQPRAVVKQEDRAIETNPKAKRLDFSDAETALIAALAPHLGGSPRRSKRFLNVYRLIKMTLPDDNDDDCRHLLLNLAVVTGVPALADAYFGHVFSGEYRTFGDLEHQLKADTDICGHPDYPDLKGVLDTVALDPEIELSVVCDWARLAMRYAFRVRPK